MTQIIKETVTTTPAGANTALITDELPEATHSQTIEYIIYFFFGLLEVLIVFRLILKALGANMASFFVRMIYSLTGLFLLPFEGIFRRGYTQGIETTAVIEPSAIVALIVYALLAWGVIVLVRILSGKKQIEQ